MNNPIKLWLEDNDLNVSKIARSLGINRSVLSSAINGNKQMPDKFIAYLKTNNPSLLVAYYEYLIRKFTELVREVVFNTEAA